MKRDMERISAELAELEKNGVILPVDVVDYAKQPHTALHGCFTWDDSEAAHQWRLEQARALIRCYVIVDGSTNVAPVRAFVSLSTDRKNDGGYRKLTEVL